MNNSVFKNIFLICLVFLTWGCSVVTLRQLRNQYEPDQFMMLSQSPVNPGDLACGPYCCYYALNHFGLEEQLSLPDLKKEDLIWIHEIENFLNRNTKINPAMYISSPYTPLTMKREL